ncbi:hypothetical protein ACFL5F_09120 [Planctomycetota bacterium]
MEKKRKFIKDLLNPDVEKPALEQLYLAHGVATDQLRRAPQVLIEITETFNHVTGRDFDPGLILRYMINRRKQADWPTLGSKARKFDSVLNELTPAQLEFLRQIYLELDIPSDEFLFKIELVRGIEQRFTEFFGIRIPGYTLVAVIVAKRKRGLWVKIREEGFMDVEKLA